MKGEGYMSTSIQVDKIGKDEVTMSSPDLNGGRPFVLRKGDNLNVRLAYELEGQGR